MEIEKTGSVGVTEVLGEHVANPPNPTTAGWTLYEVTDGVTTPYIVPALQNRVKAQFESYVRGQTLRLIALTKQTNPDEADELRSNFSADFDAGKYNWEEGLGEAGEVVRKVAQSIHGATHLMYLMMKQATPTITEKKVKELSNKCAADWVLAYRWALGNLEGPQQAQEQSAQK